MRHARSQAVAANGIRLEGKKGGPRSSTKTAMDANLDIRPLVLVVDGDARSASLLARLLRTDGYDADVTTDGAAALSRLTRNPMPAALLTDPHLSHADGLAVGRYARSRRPQIPIFLLTGDANAVSNMAEQLGEPLHVMPKPLDYPELLRRLAVALGVKSAP